MSDPGDIITDDQYPRLRARLVHDQDAHQPDGDALAPALLAWRGDRAVFAKDVFVPDGRHEIVHAHSHYQSRDLFERYLRIVHAVTEIVTIDTPDLLIWIFDTADYRAHVGHTGPIDLSGEHTEWLAWAQGDVFGVIVEQRHAGTTVWDDGRVDDFVQWRHADSLWGLYGHDYAVVTARELLGDAAVTTTH